MQIYGRFESRVAEQLQLEPSPETAELAGLLREGEAVGGAGLAEGGLLATEHVNAAPVGTSNQADASEPTPPPSRPVPLLRAALAVLAVAVTLLLAWRLALHPASTGQASPSQARASPAAAGEAGRADAPANSSLTLPATTVAVLPLRTLSPAGDTSGGDYFAAGLTEDLVNRLTGISGLRILTPDATASYRPGQKELTALARRLGAGFLIRGVVERQNDSVRVNVSMVDGRTLETRWAASYDRDLRDMFAIQADIALRVADALQVEIPARQKAALTRPLTRNPVAADLYFQAKKLFGAPSETEAGRAAIRRLLEEALRHDPKMAAAHAMHAIDIAVAAVESEEAGYAAALFDSARAEAQLAARLDPGDWRTPFALAQIDYMADRPRAAMEEALRAENLLPAGASAHDRSNPPWLIGRIYTLAGDYYRADLWGARVSHVLRDIGDRDAPGETAPLAAPTYGPGCPELWILGAWERALQSCMNAPAGVQSLGLVRRAEVLIVTGRPNEARALLDSLRSDYPGQRAPVIVAALVELQEGLYAAAERDFRSLLAGTPPVPFDWTNGLVVTTGLGFALWREGRRDQARREFARSRALDRSLLRTGRGYGHAEYDLARIHAIEANADSSVIWMRRAINHSWHWYYTGIMGEEDPMMAGVRDDPRFRRMMAHVKAELDRELRAVNAVQDSLPPSPALYQRMLAEARVFGTGTDTVGLTSTSGFRIDSGGNGPGR